jgi:hypothetical protein
MDCFAFKLTIVSIVASAAFAAPANATSIVLTADISGPSVNLGSGSPGFGAGQSFAGGDRGTDSSGDNGQMSSPWDWQDLAHAPIIIPPAFASSSSGSNASTTNKDYKQRNENTSGDGAGHSPLDPVTLTDGAQAVILASDPVTANPQAQPVFSSQIAPDTTFTPLAAAVDPAAIPEPAPYLLFGAGFALFIGLGLRRRQKAVRRRSDR